MLSTIYEYKATDIIICVAFFNHLRVATKNPSFFVLEIIYEYVETKRSAIALVLSIIIE